MKCRRSLRRHRREFDVVHVNGFITWASGDVNASHFVHSKWLQSYARDPRLKAGLSGKYQWFYTMVSARLERLAYRQARVVVAVSERVKQEIVNIGIPAERIRVSVADKQFDSGGTKFQVTMSIGGAM